MDITNEKELQEKIVQLEQENEILQKNLEEDIKTQSELIEKNIELDLENKKLSEENEQLRQEVKQTEEMAMELADNMYKIQFENIENFENFNEGVERANNNEVDAVNK